MLKLLAAMIIAVIVTAILIKGLKHGSDLAAYATAALFIASPVVMIGTIILKLLGVI